MPVSRRNKLARFGAAVGVPQLLLRLRRLRQPARWLTVLTYHRVNRPEAVRELDEGVLDATPEGLDCQLGLLRRHFTPITMEELLAYIDGRPLPANPLLVTFDDGYLDSYEIAAPILKRHGIAAAFFIATGYVQERRLFWWDRLSWILKHARRRRFSVEAQHALDLDLDRGLAHAEREVQQVIKTQAGLDVHRFLDDLTGAADAPWTVEVEVELTNRHLMTWQHVRALRRSGMFVGSHTRTHRVLQTLSPSELTRELVGARQDLETVLGEPVPVIAYPVGRPVAGVPAIREAVAAAGYRLGFTYRTGLQDLRALDRLDVHRVNVDASDSAERVLARVGSQRLFH